MMHQLFTAGVDLTSGEAQARSLQEQARTLVYLAVDGKLAALFGISDPLRHYAREQLLAPERHPDNGYQLFSDTDLERLRFIQRARKLGFSVAEIRDILTHSDQGDSPCPMVRDLLASRLPQIRSRIAELEALAHRMEQALSSWQHMPDGTPDGHSVCRLIESFPDSEPVKETL